MLILTLDDLCHHLLHQNKKKKVPEKIPTPFINPKSNYQH